MKPATVPGVTPAPRRPRHARREPRANLAEPIQADPLSETAARRHLLDDAHRQLQAFTAQNRYQSELKAATLVMIRYMREHWCEPEHAADFDRWWLIVKRYKRVLLSGQLEGKGTRKRLRRLLDENQMRPSEL